MTTLRYTLSSLLLVVMSAFMLTSCDEDAYIGSTLTNIEGRWFGDLDMYVNGQKARGSDIQFIPYNYRSTRGRGIEYDYYGRYGTYTVRHDFEWEVLDGIIHLYFDDEALDCTIRQYSLNSRYFTGWLDGWDSSTYFELYSYDYYWDDYGYASYDYGYEWYDYYRVKGQTAAADSTQALTATRAAAQADNQAEADGQQDTTQAVTCRRGVNTKRAQ
ncbi:MAG: hypothetical protein IKO12_01570 [Bacteroidaceae bacterium]|nr:hypothetical protein [Bacteroidaceae bacterium]